MAKREIDEDAAANDVTISKKRKVKHDVTSAPAITDSGIAPLTRQERVERVERKAQKIAAAVARQSESLDKEQRLKAKAVKRAEKAGLKASRKSDTIAEEGEQILVGELPTDGETTATSILAASHIEEGQEKVKVANDRATAKAARKAEKAKAKALKKANRDGEEITQSEVNGHESTSKPAALPLSGYTEDSALTTLPQSEINSFLSTNFITITDPTNANALRPITRFSYLPASARSSASPFATFKNPTPIQSAAWPFLLSSRDVIGVAETGSGKTLAFGVPCIRYITSLPPQPKKSSTARAVIVSPTRELAVQIYDQMVQLAKPAGLQVVCVYGGVPKDSQRLALKSAHIVVATPGRLNDLINEGAANLSEVNYVVLDEADRMLDKGFEEEIRKIISTTPSSLSATGSPGRQTLMFTATWPPSVRDLASTFMRFPVKITIGDNPTGELRANTRIEQKVEVVDPRSKETRLLQLIKQHQSGSSKNDRILVFCLYKKEATRVENMLRSKGLRVAAIHGDLSQEKRSASLEAFKKDGGVPLLVATDVAARGLDIPSVKLVINVTFPLTVEDYVHRIGR